MTSRAVLLASSTAAWASVIVVACVMLGGGCKAKAEPPQDGGLAEGGHPVSVLDAHFPETIVVLLEAGAEPGKPAPTSRYVTLLSGLPAPCQDTSKHLGTVTFTQTGDDVVISSSKTKARGTCVPREPGTLMCDWLGLDGKPSVQQQPVTYGPGKPVGGAFDKAHRFACKPQR